MLAVTLVVIHRVDYLAPASKAVDLAEQELLVLATLINNAVANRAFRVLVSRELAVENVSYLHHVALAGVAKVVIP